MSLTTQPGPTSAGRIPSLDGLRALSIFLVVALHTTQRISIDHHVAWGWFALFNGASGVFIFFEISGFLITSLLLQEHAKYGSISLRAFYLRRVFRILPPLYLYIGVIVLLGLAGRLALTRIDIVSALFFFHNFSGTEAMWSLEHLWSISMEEQFYLVWPFVLFFALRRSGHRPETGEAAPSVIDHARHHSAAYLPVFIVLVSPIARVVLARSANAALHRIGVFDLRFDFLMFGCLVALFQQSPRFESLYRAVSRAPWIPPATMILCNVLSVRYQNYFDLTLGYTINAAAIAFFLLWCTRNPASAIGRVLNYRPIVYIGTLSYSIYIWQTLFLHHNNLQIFGFHSQIAIRIATFPGDWLFIFIVASASYYLVEQPSLTLRNRIIRSLHLTDAQRISDIPQSLPSDA